MLSNPIVPMASNGGRRCAREALWLLDNYPDWDCFAEGISPRELDGGRKFRRHFHHAETINCLTSVTASSAHSLLFHLCPTVS